MSLCSSKVAIREKAMILVLQVIKVKQVFSIQIFLTLFH